MCIFMSSALAIIRTAASRFFGKEWQADDRSGGISRHVERDSTKMMKTRVWHLLCWGLQRLEEIRKRSFVIGNV